MATVIDQQTRTFVVADQAPTIYVSGANLPDKSQSRSTSRDVRGTRAFQLAGAGSLRDLESAAFDAAQALREWYAHARTQREAGRGPDLELVKGYVKRIVNDELDKDGVAAWVLLDGDAPSQRTIEEYRGAARDVLIWLALRGICPADTGAEDMKAYKSWLQADGAPTEMENMRSQWYRRDPRIVYEADWRGYAALAAREAMKRSLRDWKKAHAAAEAETGKRAKTIWKLAEVAETVYRAWLGTLLVVIGTYANAPLIERFPRYTSDTVSLRITLVRNFFKMALSRQAVFHNPLLEIKAGKSGTSRAQKIISRFYDDSEVLAALELCDENRLHSPHSKALAARNTAMIRLMRNHGLRVSEIVGLDRADFNPSTGEAGSVLLRHAKGDKSRTILLTDKSRESLDKWLAYRALMQTTDAALFVSMNAGGPEGGHRMNVRAVRDMWDELQRRLNIKRPGRSVHGLRHAYATRIMMEDPSALISLSLSMGHSSVTITQGYLEAGQMIEKNPAKLSDL